MAVWLLMLVSPAAPTQWMDRAHIPPAALERRTNSSPRHCARTRSETAHEVATRGTTSSQGPTGNPSASFINWRVRDAVSFAAAAAEASVMKVRTDVASAAARARSTKVPVTAVDRSLLSKIRESCSPRSDGSLRWLARRAQNSALRRRSPECAPYCS